MKAAIIGLGRMGGPLVGHAVGAGVDVSAYDIAEPAREAAAAKGASVSASAADAADGAGVVAVVVFDDQQVRDVLTGPDGALRALPPGAVVAIHTTTTLQTIREVAADAAEAGVHVIDAGISGGSRALKPERS